MQTMKQLGPLWLVLMVTLALGGCGTFDGISAAGDAPLVDDSAIETAIGDAVHRDDELKARTRIDVASTNGVVLLTGEAPTAALRERIVNIARTGEGVRVVHNEILIAAPRSRAARGADAEIMSEVRARLRGNPRVNARHVRVVVANGGVYLMGVVQRAEGAAAAQSASYVDGVTKVVTLFEYRD